MLMKKLMPFVAAAALAGSLTTATADGAAGKLTLTSPDIAEGQALKAEQVFNGFGCVGGNTAPTLKWSGAPEGTRSFALTVYDPDAPTGSGWWHWLAFNIPADVQTVETASVLPEGVVQLENDYGTRGFGGACPPPGEVHRYRFTVHALSTELELDGNVSNALAGYMINANSLASSTITAVYTR